MLVDNVGVAWVLFSCLLVADLIVAGAIGLLGERIIVSEEEIEYRGVGLWVRAPWDDVVSICQTPHGSSVVDGLGLQYPMPEIGWWYKFGTFMQSSAKILSALRGSVQGLIGEWKMEVPGEAIPIGALQKNWQQQSLGADLNRYAPHLFDAEAKRAYDERQFARPRWEKRNHFQPRPRRWVTPVVWAIVVLVQFVVSMSIWLIPALIK